MTLLLLCLLAYLAGSIPFGKLIGAMYGIDIQKYGSGNIGFANSVRALGWKAGCGVLVGDILKGYLPTMLAVQYVHSLAALAVGVAALLGHIFPLWLKFRGGKGIATGLGFTLALFPLLAIIAILTYLGSFIVYRKSAPASLTSAWILPIACSALQLGTVVIASYAALALFISWTHRSNIRQMIGSLQRAYD